MEEGAVLRRLQGLEVEGCNSSLTEAFSSSSMVRSITSETFSGRKVVKNVCIGGEKDSLLFVLL